MKKETLKESARDLISLGSIPFFILVLARVSILKNPEYLGQFLIGGLFVFLFTYLFKTNIYSGLSVVIAFFLTIYYNDFLFELFAVAGIIAIFLSLFYLGENKKKVLGGALLGAISCAISYFTVDYIFK